MEPGAVYEAVLRPIFEGRRVILAGGPVAGFTATASLVRGLGAEAVLVVGTMGIGSGPLPPPEDASWVATDVAAASMSEGVHASNRLVDDPPAEIRAAVEQFDPDRSALAVGSFLNEASEFLGRPFLAYRRPQWLALEDKLEADALWDRAGVRRAPSAVVDLERRAVTRAARSLDGGAGTVWAADASAGWHGGSEGLRWVRCDADIDAALVTFADRAERVRVMPFVEGVPCSMHGIVFDEHVAVVRPVEQVTLRRREPPGFFYAGCTTFYDPPASITGTMRDSVRRVGAELRAGVGFRGAFTIDGIVGRDGFVPTELNPRSGAGLNVMLQGQPDLPLQLLLDALVGGYRLAYDPRALEATLAAGAEANRAGGTWHWLPVVVTDVGPLRRLVGDHRGWRRAEPGEPPAGEVVAAASASGTFVRLTADPARTPVGPPFGRAAAAFWAFADRELGTSVGPLTAAAPA